MTMGISPPLKSARAISLTVSPPKPLITGPRPRPAPLFMTPPERARKKRSVQARQFTWVRIMMSPVLCQRSMSIWVSGALSRKIPPTSLNLCTMIISAQAISSRMKTAIKPACLNTRLMGPRLHTPALQTPSINSPARKKTTAPGFITTGPVITMRSWGGL